MAHVSKLAGVSTRTFHNYFSGLDEAILEYVVHSLYIPCTFLVHSFQNIAQLIQRMPESMDVLDVIEELGKQGIAGDSAADVPLHSVASLFRVGEVIEHRTLNSHDDRESVENALVPVMNALRGRLPNTDNFELEVIVHAGASAIIHATRAYQSLPAPTPERGEELVQRAIATLRSMR